MNGSWCMMGSWYDILQGRRGQGASAPDLREFSDGSRDAVAHAAMNIFPVLVHCKDGILDEG
jgi:hypothetical protein